MSRRSQILIVALSSAFCLCPLLAGAQANASAGSAVPGYVRPNLGQVAPVELEVYQQSGSMGLSLVRPSPDGVEIELRDGGGAIVVFWEFMNQFSFIMPQSNEMRRVLSLEDPKLRAERAERFIAPLLPLAGIPVGSTNIHELIDPYLRALVEAEMWDQLYQLSEQVYLDRIPQESVGYFFSAVEALFLSGRETAAQALLNQLIGARSIEESKSVTLRIAAQFMEERLFEPALRLFQIYLPHTTGEESKGILLTCAYLSLELNKQSESERFIREADRAGSDNLQARATRQLIEGVKLFKNGQYRESLNQIGFALSILPPSDSLRVVALYYNFRCYKRLGEPAIAETILKEMLLLFNSSKYTSELVGERPPEPVAPAGAPAAAEPLADSQV